ncbi:hypothetical protein [Salinisphaera sp. T31B1]|uniref:hypothetical protein n=1 Tax=Salinisphaera sp. T31B1 TaxID=727963 RepID=UPI00333FB753
MNRHPGLSADRTAVIAGAASVIGAELPSEALEPTAAEVEIHAPSPGSGST